MIHSVILTDEEVQRKKDLIQRRKDEEAQREAEREARRPRLTEEQSQVISTLVEAHHKTYDDSYSDFCRFRVCNWKKGQDKYLTTLLYSYPEKQY